MIRHMRCGFVLRRKEVLTIHFFVRFDGEKKVRSLDRIVNFIVAVWIIAMMIFSIVILPEVMDKEDTFRNERVAPYIQAAKARMMTSQR